METRLRILITGSRTLDDQTQRFVERQVSFWQQQGAQIITGDDSGVERLVRTIAAPATLTIVGSSDVPPRTKHARAKYVCAERWDGESSDDACLREMLAGTDRAVVAVASPHDRHGRDLVDRILQWETPVWAWLNGDYVNPHEYLDAAAESD